ncbi:MAG: hypothetical protein GY869_24390 [Planctomycetes bacterium]|nr:hypothetical protein [Planctomycetota bacterium]
MIEEDVKAVGEFKALGEELKDDAIGKVDSEYRELASRCEVLMNELAATGVAPQTDREYQQINFKMSELTKRRAELLGMRDQRDKMATWPILQPLLNGKA